MPNIATPLHRRLAALGYVPTPGLLGPLSRRLRKESVQLFKSFDEDKGFNVTFVPNTLADFDLLRHLAAMKRKPKPKPQQLQDNRPKPKPKFTVRQVKPGAPTPKIALDYEGLQDNPKTLLHIFSSNGLFSDYQLRTLRTVAADLSDECQATRTALYRIINNLKCADTTAKAQIHIFTYAHAFVNGTDTREITNLRLKNWSPAYRGVQSVINQGIHTSEQYQQYKRSFLESLKPPRTLKEAEELITELQLQLQEHQQQHSGSEFVRAVAEEKYTELKALYNKTMTQLEEVTAKHDSLETTYLQALDEESRLRDELTILRNLPCQVVWQGKQWLPLTLSPAAQTDYRGLDLAKQKLVKEMFLFLSLNTQHPSLRTGKMWAGATESPHGVPDSSFYSRASGKIRVFWEVLTTPEPHLMIYRIYLKD